jgi:hypothetical protein
METQNNNDLENLFDAEVNKNKIKISKYQQEQKNKWDKDLEKVNEIYDKLCFLNKKGIAIEKIYCTEFNQEGANNGHFPLLRLPQFHAIFCPIHDSEDFEFGGNANGKLTGKWNCKTLIIQLSNYIK